MSVFVFVRRSLATALLSGLVLVSTIGCGGGPPTIPVTGKVTVDGQPLAKGSLLFKPEEGLKIPREPSGTIENGDYSISTDGKPGAPLGKYKVVIVAHQEIDSTKPDAVKSPFNAKYSHPYKTDLKVEVVASPAAGAYDFKLTK